ncbi:MAG: hypothetical protein FJ387_11870 [Verrucomicrobia bacterium]|nr:hypothetical protein [Verrucomicrobiota bacterium]
MRVSRGDVEKFAAERKFRGFLETSAKKNPGCEELKQAILAGINWDEIPCRTTEVLFKRLKEEIIRLKDEGRVLLRFNELRETLQLRLSGEFQRFADEELRVVAGRGPGWEDRMNMIHRMCSRRPSSLGPGRLLSCPSC